MQALPEFTSQGDLPIGVHGDELAGVFRIRCLLGSVLHGGGSPAIVDPRPCRRNGRARPQPGLLPDRRHRLRRRTNKPLVPSAPWRWAHPGTKRPPPNQTPIRYWDHLSFDCSLSSIGALQFLKCSVPPLCMQRGRDGMLLTNGLWLHFLANMPGWRPSYAICNHQPTPQSSP